MQKSEDRVISHYKIEISSFKSDKYRKRPKKRIKVASYNPNKEVILA